uniref:Uncharacterized protein n=1 Tax=Gouania willdenowi TaxID=441366 RepID=A0A8C5HCH5_GOUWI
MIDRAQQQPQVTIRDPNQGGRDITEDIMSGRCYNPTPLIPQSN